MTIDEAYQLLQIDPNKSYTDSMIEANASYMDACLGAYLNDGKLKDKAEQKIKAAKLVYEDALKAMIRRELGLHHEETEEEMRQRVKAKFDSYVKSKNQS